MKKAKKQNKNSHKKMGAAGQAILMQREQKTGNIFSKIKHWRLASNYSTIM